MNKKAIAAFAAGATLLSGLAFAAPAFAEPSTTGSYADAASIHGAEQEVDKAHAAVVDAREGVHTAENKQAKAERDLAPLKRAADKASKDNDKAKAAVDAAQKAVDDFKNTYITNFMSKDKSKSYNDAETAYNALTGNDEAKKKTKLGNALTEAKTKYGEDETSGTQKALKEANDAVDKQQKKVDAAKDEVETAKDTLKGAEADLASAQAYLRRLKGEPEPAKPDQTKPDQTKPDQTTPDHTKPVQTADPTKSAASAELMRTQVVLAEADATNKDAQEKFVKSKAGFEAAKTQMAAFDAQVKSAADREEALRVAGKTDTDAYKAAVIDLKAAQSKANAYRTHEYANAEKDFGEKSGKALLAAAAYNAALVNYRAAYNKAVEVEASAVKGFADPNTLNPVSTDFPAAPAAAKAEAKKVEAKAEAKAQAAAPAAAAAGKAAAAKGELAGMGAKGGHGKGKAGEKLGNAGVGVALTALAASMLAGMGAAVRKMRH